MKTRFTVDVRTRKDLLEAIGMCYAPMLRRGGLTHDEFAEDVSKLKFGTDPQVVEKLQWLRENMVATTRLGAKRWASLSNNEGNTYKRKVEETTCLRRR
jgi:hypothetical protein